ncbi:hypothetical protein [Kineococcus sp. SYSU DK003]|uniref:hypothetical protein n=1 Tax=Kineococcus sp. SYSU DK003 TaxID=3383124 RepID=UPI003D7C61FF
MRRQLLTGLLVCTAALTACAPSSERASASISDWSADGNVLHLGINSCNGDPQASVVETETDITVTVTAVFQQGGDSAACMDGLAITVAAPVGERAVIDGFTGRQVDALPATG